MTLKDLEKKLNVLEKKLNVVFVDKALKLPKWLIKVLVWLMPFGVLFAILSYLYSIYLGLINFSPTFDTSFKITTNGIWAAYYIYAFKYINNYTQRGWKLLFYGALASGLIMIVTLPWSSVFLLIPFAILSVILFTVNLYFLFQVRASFNK